MKFDAPPDSADKQNVLSRRMPRSLTGSPGVGPVFYRMPYSCHAQIHG